MLILLWLIPLASSTSWHLVNQIAPPLGRRSCSAWKTSDGSFYLFGGKTATRRVNDFWRYNGEGWAQLAPLPATPRSGSCSWTRGDSLYLFGGRDDQGNALSDFWKYEGSQWVPLTQSAVPPLFGASCWQSSSAFYMYGGATLNKTLTNSLYSYSFASNSWGLTAVGDQTPGPIDDRPGTNGFIFSKDGKVYSFDETRMEFVAAYSGYALPSRQDYISYNSICFIGGKYDSDDSLVVGEGEACFDPSSKTWSINPNVIAPSSRWGACSAGEYVFGGVEGTYYHNSLWRYGTSNSGDASNGASIAAAVFSSLSLLFVVVLVVMVARNTYSKV